LNKETVSISAGNSKMGKIPSISLPPMLSCPRHAPCFEDGRCYVIKHMKFSVVVRAFGKNFRIYNDDPERYFKQISGYLDFNEPEYFRFHVGGDIPCQDYYDRIVKLCCAHKKTKFMFMTKCYMDEHYIHWMKAKDYSIDPIMSNITLYPVPSNLSIIISSWPGYPIPPYLKAAFPIAYLEDGIEDRIPEDAHHCLKHCDECYFCWFAKEKKKDVVFHLH